MDAWEPFDQMRETMTAPPQIRSRWAEFSGAFDTYDPFDQEQPRSGVGILHSREFTDGEFFRPNRSKKFANGGALFRAACVAAVRNERQAPLQSKALEEGLERGQGRLRLG